METKTKGRNGARIVLAAVAASLVAIVVLITTAQPSFAQRDPYSNGGPSVRPTLIIDESDPGDPPSNNRICCVLPFTGGNVTTFLVLGLGAVGTGTFLVRRSRSGRQEG